MFPLYRRTFPATAEELSAALGASLRRTLDVAGEPVSVREKVYPDLDEIAVDLSQAKVRSDAPHPSFPAGKGEPAMTARHFTLSAQPLSLGGAAINLAIDADGIVLHQSRDGDGNIFLLLHRADAGRVAVSSRQQDLEVLIGEIAKAEAAKQGVTIDDVRLNLTSRGARSLGAEVRLQARKLFLRATIRIAGLLEIDDQLVAHVSSLTCTGEGAIATLACGVLTPHLQKLERREFPLMALPLGQVQLHNVKLDTTDGIKATAEFGAATENQTA